MRFIRCIFPLLLILVTGCRGGTKPEAIVLAQIYTAPEELRAVEFALQDLEKKEKGWPLGRPIKVVEIEARSEPSDFEAQTIRVAQLNKPPAMIGASVESEVQSMIRGLSSEPIIALSPTRAERTVTQPNVFHLSPSPKQSVDLIMEWIGKQSPRKKIALRDNKSEDPQTLFGDLRQRITDHSELKLVNQDFEILILSGDLFEVTGLLAGEDPNSRFKTPAKGLQILYLGPIALESENFKHLQTQLKKDGISLHNLNFESYRADQKALAKRYQDKFGTEPGTTFYETYAALEIIAEAIVRANQSSAARMREELLKKEKPFETILGPVSFEADQSIRYRNVQIVPLP
jgi:ABC-type branched-subunit amino acid transport system substrate-binding protein